ncbi:MAG: hypothetical protein Q9165_007452 [Trypethelium subeluteriae]
MDIRPTRDNPGVSSRFYSCDSHWSTEALHDGYCSHEAKSRKRDSSADSSLSNGGSVLVKEESGEDASEFDRDADKVTQVQPEEPSDSIQKAQLDLWQFLRHYTISRDQTSGSSFHLELLAALKEKTCQALHSGGHTQSQASQDPNGRAASKKARPRKSSPRQPALRIPSPPDLIARSLSRKAPSAGPSRPQNTENSKRRILPSSSDLVSLQSSNSSSKLDHSQWALDPISYQYETNANKGLLEMPAAKQRSDGDAPASGIGTGQEAQSMQDLLEKVRALETENAQLKEQSGGDKVNGQAALARQPYTYKVIYKLDRSRYYFNEPEWSDNDPSNHTLLGRSSIKDLGLYLERHREVAFIVCKDYSNSRKPDADKVKNSEIGDIPKAGHEFIEINSEDMVDALRLLLSNIPDFATLFPSFEVKSALPAPYLFMYHVLPLLPEKLPQLSSLHQELLSLLADFIRSNYSQEYETAEAMRNEGHVTKRLMQYLIKPGNVVVGKRGPHRVAYVATSWAKEVQLSSAHTARYPKKELPLEGEAKKSKFEWKVQAWSWYFDGSLSRWDTSLHLNIEVDDEDEVLNLSELNVFPLMNASEGVVSVLRKRGEMFWQCRKRKFISYDKSDDEYNVVGIRAEGEQSQPWAQKEHRKDDPASELMAKDETPEGDYLLLFPPTIIGYNMRLKKWVDLEVDKFTEVAWNKSSFENLVLENETKELVEALITHQIAAERSTDLIAGKGNGLIMLLHGGPGTGKTLTAESVAEIAEKPLYRVTCGDIGTRPEDVERYLESVLHLGKIWGCLVLLDEADVFLEERTLTDLNRNALVSVFLRVLEYYSGILILTSNRVGTFDQAFKSRIQLALHYENLTKAQRRKIWRNFFNRLRTLDEPRIDFDDLYDNIDSLAEEDLNGRQIRNAITTGRQLARFQGKDFTHKHLQHVIKIAGKFEKYLLDVKEGFSDDQLARDGGLR